MDFQEEEMKNENDVLKEFPEQTSFKIDHEIESKGMVHKLLESEEIEKIETDEENENNTAQERTLLDIDQNDEESLIKNELSDFHESSDDSFSACNQLQTDTDKKKKSPFQFSKITNGNNLFEFSKGSLSSGSDDESVNKIENAFDISTEKTEIIEPSLIVQNTELPDSKPEKVHESKKKVDDQTRSLFADTASHDEVNRMNAFDEFTINEKIQDLHEHGLITPDFDEKIQSYSPSPRTRALDNKIYEQSHSSFDSFGSYHKISSEFEEESKPATTNQHLFLTNIESPKEIQLASDPNINSSQHDGEIEKQNDSIFYQSASGENQTSILHGNNRNYSVSSNDSFETFAYRPQEPLQYNTARKEDDLAQSLKRALEERERQLQDNDDIDESFLRARTADDFKSEPLLPELPPKMSLPPALPPKAKTLQRSNMFPIFHVKDKTASLGRGRWSDADEEIPPTAYKPKPLHPPPDRVIDFNKASKRSRKSIKQNVKVDQRYRNSTNATIITIPSHPSESINEVFKRQEMVSLHSSSYPSYLNGVDPYDTVQDEDEEDLSKLIQEANSLDVPQQLANRSLVDVMYPSFQRSVPVSQKPSLVPTYSDAFAKLAPTQEEQMNENENFKSNTFNSRAVSKGPYNEYSHTLPKKHRSQTSIPVFQDPLDGDDEISLADSDVKFSVPRAMDPKSLIGQQSYLCEVFPSDYTEFETESEMDNKFTSHNAKLQDHVLTPYDTVVETDVDYPEKDNPLNPIVNEDYQICTSFNKNNNTFPRRVKADKPKPKKRTNLGVMAIALTDPSTNIVQPSSMTYMESSTLRRNKSNPNMNTITGPASLFGQTPHIVVTRDGQLGSANKEDFFATNDSGPRSLPIRKKSKVKIEEAPKIHVSLNPNNSMETDPKSSNSGNLQINLLPSDDPNVINLNISSSALKDTLDASRQSKQQGTRSESDHDSSPLVIKPMEPIIAISQKNQPKVALAEAIEETPQHRVVEVAPLEIQTVPINPEPMHVTILEPQNTLVQEFPTSSVSVQQTSLIPVAAAAPQIEVIPLGDPTPIKEIVPQAVVPAFQQTQDQTGFNTSSPEKVTKTVSQPQAVSTQETRFYNESNTVRNEAHNVIVEIQNPLDEKSRTLPNDRRGLHHGGDSGIDLSHYDRNSRRR